MKFTGERYIPTEGGDIRQEHLHRYAWCRHLAASRDVLDIACGEGYGSAMLAHDATSVVGVDISPEAIDHAIAAYGSLPRLTFKLGDAARIPLADATVDLVVSFETIEHHDRHAEMLSEIRRVLRPDGLLVISSPNRDIYSERAGYHNEFHVKELDFAEFDAVLRKQFGSVCYFGQRLAVGSSIFPLTRDKPPDDVLGAFTDTGEEIIDRTAVLSDPVYFIGIAARDEPLLAHTLQSSVLFSEAEDLYTHHIEVVGWARRLDAGLKALTEKYADSVRGGEEVSAWAQAQSTALREAQAAWESEKHAREAAEQQATRRAQRDGAKLDDMARALSERDRRVGDQAAQLESAEAALAERDRRIVTVSDQLIDARGEIARNHARLRTLEQHSEELNLIKASRSWRWTRPWRFAMRTLRGGRISELDRRQLRKRFARHKTTDAGAPKVLTAPLADVPAPAPPSASVDGAKSIAPVRTVPARQQVNHRDYFVWAVIDWHFRIQRPQHLSRELAAAGHRVFYVSNNFVDNPQPGFAVEPLNDAGTLFQIHLHLQGAPQIYHAAPTLDQQEQLRAGLGALLEWTQSRQCVSLVQHPYWLEIARTLPDVVLVYDCMDHHGGFADNDERVLARESELMRDADLLVVTSDWLYERTAEYNPHRLMVRNACQFEHFAQPSDDPFKDPQGRKVIGYYGAIAEWFDLDLVEKIAQRFSDCLILLVGNDTAGAREQLAHLPNIAFTGEVPYAALPAYLDGFDVCMLPFQVIPLTLATNPVKVYEYLSAGKDVVSVALPEIRQFGDLVRIADDQGQFLAAVADALQSPAAPALIERRQHFAGEQTWSHRVAALSDAIAALRGPRVSVIVLTYNNLDMTRACLESVEQHSDYANMEVIVVDNASSDDTPAFLREWERGGSSRKIILNQDNLGFAAGNNVGLAAADGAYLVLLNNDTYVTPGWVATLLGHLRRSPTLGLLGPVTNNIGNEARIDIAYSSMEEMCQRAAAYTRGHVGQQVPMRTAAFFCVMMRRAVYEKVGPLDEAFGIGFFEDDDYCRRVEQAGWSVACAEDVFVHHHLSASFNKLKQEKRQALFETNKAIYEAKWGTWMPHRYREQ